MSTPDTSQPSGPPPPIQPADLTSPQGIMAALAAIEHDLATRQNAEEWAASMWFTTKRNRDQQHAMIFMRTTGTVAERNAQADVDTATMGAEHEAMWEAAKAVKRTLETRASICMALLKAQGKP
jgi:hypothetical protein